MCDQNVGVAKRIEIEKTSKKVADLVKGLDEEVKIDVSDVKKIQAELEKFVSAKP
jgi:hypothetical protein